MPTQLLIEFQTPNGGAVYHRDLGLEFLKHNDLADRGDERFVVRVDAETSKAGNSYYAWDLHRIPLPDGLATLIVVNGVALSVGVVHESRNGNLMRTDTASLEIDGVRYAVSALVVRTRRPYWVKVLAKRPGGRPRSK